MSAKSCGLPGAAALPRVAALPGALTLLLSLVALVSGCSPGLETAVVRGKITYKDKPVPSGTILFMPEDDRPAATGEIQPDGSYLLETYAPGDGAVLGKHSIMITAVEDQTGKLPEARNPMPALLIPVKYTNFTTSRLTAEVQAGENTFNFDLKD